MFELLACKIVVGKEEIYDYKQFYKTYNFRFNFLRERRKHGSISYECFQDTYFNKHLQSRMLFLPA